MHRRKALVIGADQVLALRRSRSFDKPGDMAAARATAARPARQDARAASRRWRWPRAARSSGRTRRGGHAHHARILPTRFSTDYLAAAGDGVCQLRRRLPARRPRHPALRARSTATISPFSACRSCRCSAELRRAGVDRRHDQRALRHRLADRAFALADDPWLLAERIRHRRRLREGGGAAGGRRRASSQRLRAQGLCRLQRHPAAQGGGLRGGASRRTRRRAPSAPPTRCGSRTAGCTRPTPTPTAS